MHKKDIEKVLINEDFINIKLSKKQVNGILDNIFIKFSESISVNKFIDFDDHEKFN